MPDVASSDVITVSAVTAAINTVPSCEDASKLSLCSDACISECRGFAPGFASSGCVPADDCINPPAWAKGSVCACSAGPRPTPTPTPPTPTPTPPTPTPTPGPIPAAYVIGYWDTTWSHVNAPAGATIGIAFSGWNDPKNGIAESNAVKNSLVGAKWIDCGGGGYNGRWNTTWISAWTELIEAGSLSSWDGIVLDVEECFDEGLAELFAGLLHAAKVHGLGTMVTTSHSAPYMCKDAKALMQSFFTSDDCDYLSPQLYAEGGDQTKPSFVITSGADVSWDDWVDAKPMFIPSLTRNALAHGGYETTQVYFASLGINCSGYVEWPTST